MKLWPTLPAVVLVGAAVLAADPPATSGLVVVDAAGKEQTLKSWKFAAGTRPLGWLAAAAAPKGAKPGEAGPVAIEFRDEHSTTLKEGILTLLLPEHLKALEYDNEKQTVTASIFLSEKADGDLKLTGSTKYTGINKLTIEAEVDKGQAGVAEVKYQGGAARGVRAIRFPAPKPVVEPKGRPAFVAIADEDTKHAEQVTDLQPLYRLADGGERLVPTLLFKKTLKLDVGKVARLQATERAADGTECRVTTKDGEEQTYTLLKAATLDGQAVTLEGFIGKVRGGYKLYPAATLASMHFDVQFDEKKGQEKP